MTHGRWHGEVARHAQQVQRHLGRPAPPPAGRPPDVRAPAVPADPRHRPDVLPARLRRQPDGLQRLADDGARLPQPAARAQGARRPDGGLRPAPDRDRQGRHRAPLRATRLRRARAARHAQRGVRRRGSTTPPSYVDGLDAAAAAVADFTPEAAEAASGIPAEEIRRLAREFAAADGAAAYGRIGVSTQGFGTHLPVGDPAPQPGHGQPRPRGRDDVHHARHRRGRHRAHRPRAPRRLEEPGPRAARSPAASCRSRCCARRSTRRARARSGRCSRWRATRCCPRPTAPRLDEALRRPGLHGGGRHLRQRDHPARRRDPAADQRPRARPLRPGLPPAGGAQHGAVHPCGVRQAQGRAARLGDLPRDRAAHVGAARSQAVLTHAPQGAGAAVGQPDPGHRRTAAPRSVRCHPAAAAQGARRRRPRTAAARPAPGPAAREEQADRRSARAGHRRPGPAARRAGA